MLDARIYRASLLPVLLVLIVVAFSLEDRPGPLRSSFAPDAFEGARAARLLDRLEREYPSRRAGSAGDQALAGAVASELRRALPGRVAVRQATFRGDTLDGERDLVSVTAQTPGSTPRSQVVLVAQRDAAARGAKADLSGTAALVEIARVLAASRPARSVTVASVSGASGGQAGMRDLVRRLPRPVDAVIEIGDLAGEPSGAPVVVAWGESGGTASIRLQRTVALAVRREVGAAPGFPLARTQLVRLALPVSVSGQGVALDAGLAAVRLSLGGELPSRPDAAVSTERLAAYGQAAVRVLDALDGPLTAEGATDDLVIAKKVLPAWAVRLLAAGLLLPAALTILDGLLRQRRRGSPLLGRVVWVLALALPFVTAALLARALGLAHAVPELKPPAPPGAVPLDAGAWTAIGCVLVALALVALVARPWVLRRAGVKGAPHEPAAGLAVLLVTLVLAIAAWSVNPYAALLLVLPLNAWLLLVDREIAIRRGFALALLVASLAPVALVFAVYADELSMSVTEVPWFWLLAFAGGELGPLTAIGWSLAAGRRSER